jgi:hypothetical protein
MKPIRQLRAVLAILLITSTIAVASATEANVHHNGARRSFAFANQPSVNRNGDTVTIAFSVKSFCDVTVAVENSKGTTEGRATPARTGNTQSRPGGASPTRGSAPTAWFGWPATVSR